MRKPGQKNKGIKGLRCEIIKDDGFTPCLFVEVDATSDKKFERSVFFYGHLDKQPPNEGWIRIKAHGNPSFKTAVSTDAVLLMTVMPSTLLWLQ